MTDKDMALDAPLHLDALLERYNERRRPIHHSALVKVPGGPAYRCHLYISPLSRVVLSYRFEPEPVH